jgi:large subunit ribosomal protein L30
MAVGERRTRRKPEKAGSKVKSARAAASENQLKIKLIRSLIGRPEMQREVVKGLGLRKVNSEVIRRDGPEIWGMIRKIPHLLKVEVLEKK